MIKKLLQFKTNILVGLFVILTKGTSLIKDIILTSVLGVGSISDVFILSYSVTTTIFGALAAAIGICYIPVYNKTVARGDNANMINGRILIFSILLSVGVIFVFFMFKTPLLNIYGQGLTNEALMWLHEMMEVMIWSLPAIAIYNVFAYYIQNKGLPIVASSYQMIGYMILIIGVYICAGNMTKLSLSVLIGHFIILIFLLIVSLALGFRVSYEKGNTLFSEFLIMLVPIFLSSVIADINSMIDKSLATKLPVGTVTGMDYAYKLSSALFSIIASVVSLVLYPKVSKQIALGQKEEIEDEILKGINYVTSMVIPVIVICFLLAEEIIKFLFLGRGFDGSALMIMRNSFLIYLVSVFPLSMRIIIEKLYWGLQRSKTTFIFSTIGVFVNIILNFLLINIWGYCGLAIATVLSAFVVMILYFWGIKNYFKKGVFDQLLNRCIQTAICASIASFFVLLIKPLFCVENFEKFILFMEICISTFVFGGMYVICNRIIDRQRWKISSRDKR